MYTAKVAREKAEQQISNKVHEQLSWAEKCIKNAVEKGDMSCLIARELGKQAIRELERLGYTVKDRSNQRDGVEYEISWDTEE